MGFYGSNHATNSVKALKEEVLNCHPCVLSLLTLSFSLHIRLGVRTCYSTLKIVVLLLLLFY